MSLDVLIEDQRWAELGLEAIVDRAVRAACAHLGLEADRIEASLLACDDARIQVLNQEFRGKPDATNVLSWPAEDLAAAEPGATPRAPQPDFEGAIDLGDIAIAYETCTRESQESGKETSDHVAHLVVHGLLHLLGYDHERDLDAAVMERIEVDILGRLGIDDPYMSDQGA